MTAKKNLVNWSDCMALSSAVFNQQDNYFIDSIRDSIEVRTNSFNYGLLPGRGERMTENTIQITQHVTGHIEVRLQSCDAITSSGIRIHYDASVSGYELVKTYAVESDKVKNIHQWDIILAVDPFNRTASGNPDPAETPPRHPDSEFACRLYIMPKGEINTREFGAHYLTIGRIREDAGRFTVDAGYIPPSATMKSHPELQTYYNGFGKMFRSMENHSKSIIAKIHNRNNDSDLAANITLLCREILRYTASMQFGYTHKAIWYPPISIMEYVSGLAHVMYVSFSFLSGPRKEEVLKYFYEWSDVTPGSFEEMLCNILEISYDHTDIRSGMVQTDSFMKTINELWERLSTLEYIGQHKENIVVSERTSGNVSGQNKSWTIMD